MTNVGGDERGRGRTWAGTPWLEPAAAPAGWGGVQAGEQRGDGFFRGERGGGDGVVGETAVDGLAREKARLGGGGVGQDRAGLRRRDRCGGCRCGRCGCGVECLHHAAVEEGGEGGVEEDGGGGGGLLDEQAVGKGFGGASAESEDDVAAAEGRGEGLGLQLAEVGFAVGGEDGGDREAGAGFDRGVEVEEIPAEAGGEQTADGGLAGAHKTGEDDTEEMGGQGQGVGRLGGLACGGVGGLDLHGGSFEYNDKSEKRKTRANTEILTLRLRSGSERRTN